MLSMIFRTTNERQFTRMVGLNDMQFVFFRVHAWFYRSLFVGSQTMAKGPGRGMAATRLPAAGDGNSSRNAGEFHLTQGLIEIQFTAHAADL